MRPGWRVLEIGPGQGSLHVELRRRVRGPVDAVERSPAFAQRLEALCDRDGFGRGALLRGDLGDAPLPEARYDLIFARWVFLFLPDPAAHLRRIVRALKPGGRLALEDYHRETFALVPRPPDWDAFLGADRAFFASQGGDVSIGGRLPTLFRQAGLRVVEVRATTKTGHPGSPVWRWLSAYFVSVIDRYAAHRPLTPAAARRLERWWRAAGRHRTSLLIGPTVLDVVGRRPFRTTGRAGR